MKRIFTLLIATILLLLSVQNLKAQTLNNIPCTGFNVDIVADGATTSTASTNAFADNGVCVFVDNTFTSGSGSICTTTGVYTTSMPTTGGSGLTYNLQPANGNNAMQFTTNIGSGTLYLVNPIPCTSLYFLAVLGNGNSNGGSTANTTVTVTFTDSTTQQFTGIIIKDWVAVPTSGSAPLNNTKRSTSTTCNLSLGNYFQESSIMNISAANQSKKISSVSFSATETGNGTFNVFALAGVTPASFQTITFPTIPFKLTTTLPFALNATATSGLPVSYTVISGPATITNDSIVNLTGTAGTVTIKAYQNGNVPQYDTATPVITSFEVIDPYLVFSTLEARHPLAGNVYMPTLSKIQLAAISNIDDAPLITVQQVSFIIDGGSPIPANDFGNLHYTAWWQPSTYGPHTIVITSTSNFGTITSTTVNVNVVATSVDTTVLAFDTVWLNSNIITNEATFNLPSYIGAYDSIYATLSVTCPTGGCGAWDHTASVEALSHEGNLFEIIRYITPYATACSHVISVNDYMSLLCGRVTFRLNCTTYDNGYLYTLTFTYKSGTPVYKYSQVTQIWRGNYDFGHYGNLEPVSVYNFTYPAGVLSSKLKLTSTGHMGPNNTGNAAEFYDATHHIHVNNVDSFAQHNWQVCNPNPDHCSPQSGTWQYNRAGWCPGSIAHPFDYDFTQYIASNNIALQYVFSPGYVDQCSAYYPGCVTSSSCTCSDGLNPFLVVACNLINFFNDAPPDPVVPGIKEAKNFGIAVYPNPSNGEFNLTANNKPDNICNVTIYNLMGNVVKQFQWNGENTTFNLSNSASGVYILKVSNKDKIEVKKLMLR